MEIVYVSVEDPHQGQNYKKGTGWGWIKGSGVNDIVEPLFERWTEKEWVFYRSVMTDKVFEEAGQGVSFAILSDDVSANLCAAYRAGCGGSYVFISKDARIVLDYGSGFTREGKDYMDPGMEAYLLKVNPKAFARGSGDRRPDSVNTVQAGIEIMLKNNGDYVEDMAGKIEEYLKAKGVGGQKKGQKVSW